MNWRSFGNLAFTNRTVVKRNINRTPEQHLAYTHGEIARYKELGIPVRDASVSDAFGCNFQGDIAVEKVVECVGTLMALAAEHGVEYEKISLADTMAWATPVTIKRVIGAVRDKYPDANLSLHLHDTLRYPRHGHRQCLCRPGNGCAKIRRGGGRSRRLPVRGA